MLARPASLCYVQVWSSSQKILIHAPVWAGGSQPKADHIRWHQKVERGEELSQVYHPLPSVSTLEEGWELERGF